MVFDILTKVNKNEIVVHITIKGWKHIMGGHFGHFHDMYVKYICAKCIAFNFGFHFWCLGLIYCFAQS